MNEDNIFVGLDIGTTKIATVVARLDEHNILNIVGVGTHPSDGLRRGVELPVTIFAVLIVKASLQSEVKTKSSHNRMWIEWLMPPKLSHYQWTGKLSTF